MSKKTLDFRDKCSIFLDPVFLFISSIDERLSALLEQVLGALVLALLAIQNGEVQWTERAVVQNVNVRPSLDQALYMLEITFLSSHMESSIAVHVSEICWESRLDQHVQNVETVGVSRRRVKNVVSLFVRVENVNPLLSKHLHDATVPTSSCYPERIQPF